MPAFPGIVNTDANEINITAHIIADKRESNSKIKEIKDKNKIQNKSNAYQFGLEMDRKTRRLY